MKCAKKVFILTIFTLLCFFTRASASETPSDIMKNFGDVLIYMAPSVAFGMTLLEEDNTGVWQFTKSVVVTMGVCTSLKYSVHSRRPNGDPQSFPSGHTAIVVQSAEFMRQRYGWKYGLPVYVVAAYVGYSRIRSDDHHMRDVLAGAVIGFVGTYWFTTPYEGWNIQPVAGSSYLGVNLSRNW
jgi:membrane-associated phospholipid phosphatase